MSSFVIYNMHQILLLLFNLKRDEMGKTCVEKQEIHKTMGVRYYLWDQDVDAFIILKCILQQQVWRCEFDPLCSSLINCCTIQENSVNYALCLSNYIFKSSAQFKCYFNPVTALQNCRMSILSLCKTVYNANTVLVLNLVVLFIDIRPAVLKFNQADRQADMTTSMCVHLVYSFSRISRLCHYEEHPSSRI
jgi:hypothetical protein